MKAQQRNGAIIVGANIGKAKRPAIARRNIVKIRKAFPEGQNPTVLWNEINEGGTGDEAKMIATIFGPKRYEHGALGSREPISVATTEFDVRPRVRRAKILDGIPYVTPDRFVVVKMATPIGCEDDIAFVNTHFANMPPDSKGWRRCLDGLREAIDLLARNKVTTVWSGDTNSEGQMPKVHPGERRIISTRNDHMGIIPGSVRVEVRAKGTVALTIDGHNAHWARLRFVD